MAVKERGNIYSVRLFGLSAAVVLLAAASFAQFSAGQFTVTSGRPLADAALRLEQERGIPINYEDIRMGAQSKFVADVTDSVMSPAQKRLNPGSRITVLQRIELSASVIIGVDGVAAEPRAALLSLVTAYNDGTRPGAYKVESANGMLYVEPTRSIRLDDTAETISAVLGAPVTLPFSAGDATATLRAILDQVAARAGYKIGIATLPVNAFVHATVSVGSGGEPARDVIARLFAQVAPQGNGGPVPLSRISYQLRFDPRLQYYLFSAHIVEPSGVSLLASQNTQGAKPAPGVWFTARP